MASKKQSAKVAKVMREYKSGTLHSGKGGPKVKNVRQAVAIALSEAGLDTETQRKQKRGWDRNAKVMNGFAEQEYKRRKPKSEYDKPTLPPKASVGPDTGRTGKHNARTQTGVQRRPSKGPKRKPAIEQPVYRRSGMDYWKI